MKRRVLIAEDDSNERFVLEKTFAQHDIDILSTDNGKEALKLLRSNPDIGLIIADIIMPEMNGLELRKAQLREPALKDIPIVFVTPHLTLAEPAQELSPQLILTKPLTSEDLNIIVLNLLTRV